MDQITVKSQAEWDAIPEDFKGIIYIESERYDWLKISKRQGCRIEARGNSSVEAWGNSSVEAWGNSSVEARENSSVVARENSSVVARENSSVEAWGNSSVVARENSSVVARENSSVEAWGNSSVDGQGNAQIVKRSDVTTLKTKGNARIVTMPTTPEEYCDFYGLDVQDGKAILYKSVTAELRSFHDRNFQYAIGESKQETCDPNVKRDCSFGLHVSHLPWALDFGRQYTDFRIIECAVPLDKIVVPLDSCGKVRTSELTVLREVPKEEWGVYGRVMCK